MYVCAAFDLIGELYRDSSHPLVYNVYFAVCADM